MARGAKFLLKWVLVPAAVTVVGWVFVGPRMGADVAGVVRKTQADIAKALGQETKKTGPDVEVRVEPGKGR